MIGIFDSGAGGLSVFREIRRILPQERYAYFSDKAYCPYGEKPVDTIIERSRQITKTLISKGADIIVVACNTATAAAIKTLRAEFSEKDNPEVSRKVLELSGGRHRHISFIGMEPAVKPAVGATRTGVVGILATAGTLKGQKYHDTRDLYKGEARIVERVGKGFVELVEKGVFEGKEAEETVAASLIPMLEEGADTIVLGCTHYPFLKDCIKKVASDYRPADDIVIIDPSPAVARHTLNVLQEEKGIMEDGFYIELLSSADTTVLEDIYRMI